MDKNNIENKMLFCDSYVEIVYLKDSASGKIKKGYRSKIKYQNAKDLINKGIAEMLN